MQADFWHDMWESGVVGFHQTEINAFLQGFWQKLELTGDETVLVPLCGKSLDMLWLKQQGHKVLGIELSQKALDEFISENHIDAQPVQQDKFCAYGFDAMTLLCGDFFHLTADDCCEVKAVYDRAAIVALPEAMRRQYVEHLKMILPKGTQFLMVTMEYDQSQLQGPPFSVPETEVRELFAGFASVDKVSEQAFSRKGVAAVEKVFVMRF
ncbi:thiopurine S-methyltransferase [Thiomicrorhabdus sp. ZW0627]|uniref:thiopurine S-methyltransferase n=1 Tax=Thiomicrorhabdus sp. ZW0627 TaxID=3039774 RepID=UPI002436D742|nr:thiopurine S-methyltransferase [Thiomicrorhabdus sp. ZW0627]MDG6773710.1 thiopurine S-methyltransferase [Thiomicrorhabdus sp. ZW0627]